MGYILFAKEENNAHPPSAAFQVVGEKLGQTGDSHRRRKGRRSICIQLVMQLARYWPGPPGNNSIGRAVCLPVKLFRRAPTPKFAWADALQLARSQRTMFRGRIGGTRCRPHDACRTPHILRRMQYAELVLNCVHLRYHSPERESRGNTFIVV